MHKYRVVDRRVDECRVLLEGGAGRYHWARVLNQIPDVGTVLTGSLPHLGFGLLLDARSERPIRVIFEAVNGRDRNVVPRWPFTSTPAAPGSVAADH